MVALGVDSEHVGGRTRLIRRLDVVGANPSNVVAKICLYLY